MFAPSSAAGLVRERYARSSRARIAFEPGDLCDAGANEPCSAKASQGSFAAAFQACEWSQRLSPFRRARKVAVSSKARRAEDGGEGGIRTLGRLSPTRAFQARAFDHSATSPGHVSSPAFARAANGRRGQRNGAPATGQHGILWLSSGDVEEFRSQEARMKLRSCRRNR